MIFELNSNEIIFNNNVFTNLVLTSEKPLLTIAANKVSFSSSTFNNIRYQSKTLFYLIQSDDALIKNVSLITILQENVF